MMALPSQTVCHTKALATGYVKDIVPRYRTMAGNYVPRVLGSGLHGLPAELEAEKQLGITDKAQIEDMGLEKFNDYCAESVSSVTPMSGKHTSPVRLVG